MANRLKDDEKNERIIRNLLKLPENRRCINCNSLGPQYVCTNFSTFVCTNCSGIHREFTHRVKSVSMAKFTPQEVSALQGGGNASAREIYLKEWDAQRNSSPDGRNVERLRTFIKHVYVDRRFTGEKNLEKPLRAKMGETDEFNTNRTDSHQASSRSPPYGDLGDRPWPGGRSPGYNQEGQRNSGDNKRSPARPEVVVNDWRREDRFGNGRMSEDRSSDAGSKPGGRSPDSQRSDMSSPPMVRPVRDILGDNVSPLRVIEPPKAKSIDPPPHAQRTASSSSLASSTDGNPPEVKVEVSFIDFDDSVPEPQTVPQEKASSDPSAVQPAAPSGDNWANFDFAPQAKANTAASNSLESSLLDLSVPSPASGPSSSMGISSFQSNASPFGVTAPTPASLGAPAQLTNTSGSLPANVPTGGQWPNMMPQPVTPAIPGFSSMPQNPLAAPYTHGPPGVSVGQTPAMPAMDTSVGFSAEPLPDTKSGGRKELPADLFAMNYSYVSPPAQGWYSGSPYGAGVHMQYNMPMALPNMQPVPNMQPQPLHNMQPVPRSTNPFDFSNEPSSDQPSTFPSLTSLQGALPRAQPPSALPSYASPSPYAGQQQIGGNIAPRPQTQSGFGLEENAFTSLYPNHQLGGLHTAHSATNNFMPTSGNPFG